MRIRVRLIVWLLALSGVQEAFLPDLRAQTLQSSKLSPYTKSVVSTVKRGNLQQTHSRPYPVVRVAGRNGNVPSVNAFVLLQDASRAEMLESCGAKVNSVIGQLVTVCIPVDSIGSLAALPGVIRIDAARPVALKMDRARAEGGVDAVQLGSNLPRPFDGTGVLVGIVDTGFEYAHPGFRNSSGHSLRIRRVWNQDNEKGPFPEGFYYGTELKTEAEILNARYDVVNMTHATHVTGIAAGSDRSTPYYGVAPGCELALVGMSKVIRDNVTILDGVKYLFDYAASVGKPCVVNLSLGVHTGPHDGTSLFDQACDELQGPGRLMVGAAGNEGETPLHVEKQISPVDTLKTFVSFPAAARYGDLDFWGEPGQAYRFRLFVYNRNTGKQMFVSDEFDASLTNEKTYRLKSLQADGAVGLIDVYTEINPLNGKANAYIEVSLDAIAQGNYVGLTVTGEQGRVNGWINGNGAAFTDHYFPGWVAGDTDCTVGEIGGTGKRIISVGAYVTRNDFTNLAGDKRETEYVPDGLASFSSKGPTADGRMKPDVTAPGAVILSSYSDAVLENSAYRSLFVGKYGSGPDEGYYGALYGTSMAAPFISGVLATWLEAYPELTPEEVRTVLRNTSRKDVYTGEQSGNVWGYGKVDALAGIREVLELKALGMNGETVISGESRIYQVPGGFRICFLTEDSGVEVSVYDLNGQVLESSFIGPVAVSQDEWVPLTLGKGIYVVKIKGDRQCRSVRLALDN